jgi:hypothetical protein
MYRLILDGALYIAPLKKVHRALDLGTGTGKCIVRLTPSNNSQVYGPTNLESKILI